MPPQDQGRRTSTRTTRTINRPENYYVPFRDLTSSKPPKASAPTFFPAITHFTDAVAALPKELIKHFSMLKEVEAKACDPERTIQNIIQEIDRLPVLTKDQSYAATQTQGTATAANSAPPSTAGSVQQDPSVAQQQLTMELYPPNFESLPADQQAALYRRQLFLRLRYVIHSMLPTLDEKIVVLSSANQTLSKGLTRMESSYKHLGEEISDEARYGSMTHWAYTDIREEKKKAAATNERSRRDVAAANNLAAAAALVHETDMVASRSELRREAMLAAKKSRGNHHLDSDFDDRPASKRTHSSKSVKKVAPNVRKAQPSENRAQGLGITNAPSQPTKRRKIEKEEPAPPAMERSLSAAMNQAPAKTGGVSPRETPTTEPIKKRVKAPPGSAPSKKRTQTQAVQSPQLTSSPLVGSFTPKDLAPAPRPSSARARQNSVTNALATAMQEASQSRNRPSSSSSNRPVNAPPTTNAPQETEQPAPAYNPDVPQQSAEAPAPTESTETANLKREEAENSAQDGSEAQNPVVTRAGRVSKTSTPVQSSFPESVPMGRSRSTRNNNNGGGSHASSESGAPSAAPAPPKRSHKKGGSISAASAGAIAPANHPGHAKKGPKPRTGDARSDASSAEGDNDEDDEDVDEKRYCICGRVSFGEMVACDNSKCDREWFHLECVGLSKAPEENEKWYCTECKRKGFGRASGRAGNVR